MSNVAFSLVAIRTSGHSENVQRAIEAGRRKGLPTTALRGGDGGRRKQSEDIAICVPSSDAQHIQESRLAAEHLPSHLAKENMVGEILDAKLLGN